MGAAVYAAAASRKAALAEIQQAVVEKRQVTAVEAVCPEGDPGMAAKEDAHGGVAASLVEVLQSGLAVAAMASEADSDAVVATHFVVESSMAGR